VVGFLARHEWKLLTTSAVVRVVLIVFCVVIGAAMLLGAARAARDRQTYDVFVQRAAQQRSQPPSLRADVVANEKGWLAVVPPAPLAALAVGQSDVYPSYLRITARNLDALVTGDQIEHPLAVASGHLDLAFLVLFLYPLLIFAVSFDLTATERDRGTLRMVLAQPVSLRDVVAGKMIARVVLLAIPVIAIPLLFAATAKAAALRPLVIWTIAVIAYGLIWHGLALIVNARGWSAPANALVLAGIWLLFAIVGPATINLLIAVRYPMPSRVEAAVQARAATQEATLQGSRQLGQFLQDHPTSANVGRDGMRQFALLQAKRDQQVADRLERVEAAFDAQLERQRRLAGWLSVLSPTMVMQGVLLEAAGTSANRFGHFRAAAGGFQREWKAYFEPRVLDAATLTGAEIAAAPAFTYQPEPTSVMVQRTAPPIAAMLIAGILLLLAGFKAYRRYSL
jgi:ABC-2 type transport system permease protein